MLVTVMFVEGLMDKKTPGRARKHLLPPFPFFLLVTGRKGSETDTLGASVRMVCRSIHRMPVESP